MKQTKSLVVHIDIIVVMMYLRMSLALYAIVNFFSLFCSNHF